MTMAPEQVPLDAEDHPATRQTRLLEKVVAAVGVVLSVVSLGGFSRVMGSVDLVGFTETLYPGLLAATGASAAQMPPEEAFETLRTMGAWFGFTLLAVLLLSAVGYYVAHRHPNRRVAGWWFLAAGMACLIGSQLVLFPVAFPFFLTAGLFALRPSRHGSAV